MAIVVVAAPRLEPVWSFLQVGHPDASVQLCVPGAVILAALWLIAEPLRSCRPWAALVLIAGIVAAARLGVSVGSEYTYLTEASGRFMLFYDLMAFTLVGSLLLARFSPRASGNVALFAGWLLVWLVVLSMGATAIYSPKEAQETLLLTAQRGLALAGVLWGMSLPFTVLAFSSKFFHNGLMSPLKAPEADGSEEEGSGAEQPAN